MKKNFIVPVIALILAAVFYFLAGQIPTSMSKASVGSAFWPRMISLLMFVFSLILIFRNLKAKKQVTEETTPEAAVAEEPAREKYPHNLWISFVLLAAYTFIMNYIGFVIATLLFLGINAWIMGTKKWKVLIPVTVLMTAALVYLFPIALTVPLPRGIGFFRNFSLLFY